MEALNKTDALLNISIALSAEKDKNKLFNMIINTSMELTHCDAGTLYILNDKGELEFRIMKTLSMGVDRGADGNVIDLPPVSMKEENICAYAAIHKMPLNISDVYTSDRFDFSGPKRYDSMTGYHTQSMMAIPLINGEDNVVGVLQLINAVNEDGDVVPFNKSLEEIVLALSSQTAIAVSNMKYQEEIKELLWSFTEAMAAAIDERTPYNANHTRNVAKYSGMLADYINKLHDEGKTEEYFDTQRREQLVMGALLHDIGKLVTPLEVMNKATRLEGKLDKIIDRLNIYALKSEVKFLKGEINKEEYEKFSFAVTEAENVAKEVNSAGFVGDELKERLEKIIDLTFNDEDVECPFFTEDEKEELRIQKGTLTQNERKIMEDHVAITGRILSKVRFNSYFSESPKLAVKHHECLNGKGYPKHLTEEDLETDARIIAVSDICDALLATDRPYKKPLPKEKAFAIMEDMAKNGNIDSVLVEYLKECLKD